MKIIADDKIPFITELFGGFGEVVLMPGAKITHGDLIDADILITRTVTQVNAELLKDSSVKFVGSATAGHDHLDTDWLTRSGIVWSYAPGANATAVAEYVIACLALLQTQQQLPEAPRVGIIGVGHIGSKAEALLKALNISVICNDPPRAERDKNFFSTDLSEFHNLDLICLHTPLTKTGRHPTYHLINDAFLKKLNPACVLLNAGRGGVIDNKALVQSPIKTFCLDVWEHEPHIYWDALEKATIATPHIAGYTEEAKFQATYMIYEQVLKHFNLPDFHGRSVADTVNKTLPITANRHETWQEIVLKIYNPNDETEVMKKSILKTPSDAATLFSELRQHYVFRHEFSSYKIEGDLDAHVREVLRKLGIKDGIVA